MVGEIHVFYITHGWEIILKSDYRGNVQCCLCRLCKYNVLYIIYKETALDLK